MIQILSVGTGGFVGAVSQSRALWRLYHFFNFFPRKFCSDTGRALPCICCLYSFQCGIVPACRMAGVYGSSGILESMRKPVIAAYSEHT